MADKTLPPDMPEEEPKTLAELLGDQVPEGTDSTTELVPESLSQPVIDSEEQNFIRIDKRNLAKEIDRLQIEHPDFAQVFNSKVGNKAARQYQPQLQELA